MLEVEKSERSIVLEAIFTSSDCCSIVSFSQDTKANRKNNFL